MAGQRGDEHARAVDAVDVHRARPLEAPTAVGEGDALGQQHALRHAQLVPGLAHRQGTAAARPQDDDLPVGEVRGQLARHALVRQGLRRDHDDVGPPHRGAEVEGGEGQLREAGARDARHLDPARGDDRFDVGPVLGELEQPAGVTREGHVARDGRSAVSRADDADVLHRGIVETRAGTVKERQGPGTRSIYRRGLNSPWPWFDVVSQDREISALRVNQDPLGLPCQEIDVEFSQHLVRGSAVPDQHEIKSMEFAAME